MDKRKNVPYRKGQEQKTNKDNWNGQIHIQNDT